jgi:hypothetical protein
MLLYDRKVDVMFSDQNAEAARHQGVVASRHGAALILAYLC